MKTIALTAVLAIALGGARTPTATAPGLDEGWSKEIPFTTDWDEAIKECKATGKLLFIYNGWQKQDI